MPMQHPAIPDSPRSPDTSPGLFLTGTPVQYLAAPEDGLRHVLENPEIACLRIDPQADDPDACKRAADLLLEIARHRPLSVLIRGHPEPIGPLGLAGTQPGFSDMSVREARKLLGEEHVIGFGPVSRRHSGMAAAEADADLVAIGPFGETQGEHATEELLEGWSQLIVIPCLAEGGILPENAQRFSRWIGFIAIGGTVWESPHDLVKGVGTYISALRR